MPDAYETGLGGDRDVLVVGELGRPPVGSMEVE
jgi:hypothetical protein